MVVDEAEHFPAQSACQRRFAPTAVRLPRNTVRLPAGITVYLHRNPQSNPLELNFEVNVKTPERTPAGQIVNRKRQLVPKIWEKEAAEHSALTEIVGWHSRVADGETLYASRFEMHHLVLVLNHT
jgi:hypothetical protein